MTWAEWIGAALATVSFCVCAVTTYYNWAWRWQKRLVGIVSELSLAFLLLGLCLYFIAALFVRIPR